MFFSCGQVFRVWNFCTQFQKLEVEKGQQGMVGGFVQGFERYTVVCFRGCFYVFCQVVIFLQMFRVDRGVQQNYFSEGIFSVGSSIWVILGFSWKYLEFGYFRNSGGFLFCGIEEEEDREGDVGCFGGILAEIIVFSSRVWRFLYLGRSQGWEGCRSEVILWVGMSGFLGVQRVLVGVFLGGLRIGFEEEVLVFLFVFGFELIQGFFLFVGIRGQFLFSNFFFSDF